MDAFVNEWEERGRGLAARFPLDRLDTGAVARLRASPPGALWGIACSGGADSVCLAILLHAHFPGRRADMRILHFNHRLRGVESDRDAASVEALARRLGLRCEVGAWESAPAGGASAAEARQARFGFFQRVLAAADKPLLILGQQRDDIVESQLMALSRGGGTASLAAPRPVSTPEREVVRLRPLLDLGADEIRRVLQELSIPWREDASNSSRDYYRNRLRQAVLPVWREASPFDVARGAAAARIRLEEDDAALKVWTDRVMESWSHEDGFPAAAVRDLPRAVVRRALTHWLAGEGLREHLASSGFEELMAAMAGKDPFRRSAGPEALLCFDGEVLRREGAAVADPPWTGEVYCPLGAEVHFPGGRRLRVGDQNLDARDREAVLAGEVDHSVEAVVDSAGMEARGVLVRFWRPGDRFHPLGAPGSRKLQDIFTDRKIDVEERRRLPLVCTDEGSIIWCPGFPPAERFKIGGLTRRVVRLTYRSGGAS